MMWSKRYFKFCYFHFILSLQIHFYNLNSKIKNIVCSFVLKIEKKTIFSFSYKSFGRNAHNSAKRNVILKAIFLKLNIFHQNFIMPQHEFWNFWDRRKLNCCSSYAVVKRLTCFKSQIKSYVYVLSKNIKNSKGP